MTNKEIAGVLKLQAKLMEVHDENSFKAKAYTNAAFQVGKYSKEVFAMSEDDLPSIPGVRGSMTEKLIQIRNLGTTDQLQALLEKTPDGILEMLNVKGLGGKKIRLIWKELEIESIGELLYACNENRLAQTKGFGEKTQASVKESIEYLISNQSKFHYFRIEGIAQQMLDFLQSIDEVEQADTAGAFRRQDPILDELTFVVQVKSPEVLHEVLKTWEHDKIELDENTITLFTTNGLPITFHCCEDHFIFHRFISSSTPGHIEKMKFDLESIKDMTSETEVYDKIGKPFIPVYSRVDMEEENWYAQHSIDEQIQYEHLKGVLHNHSTYSDGMHSLKEMADYCAELGFEYLGICDHSKTAVYAGGLKEEDILRQHEEIDSLNASYDNFKIFKGIESDILNDGNLDYEDNVLASFDFIVASVHQNLKMDEEKATARLIKAIENPYTTILGHPTGRLLLSRPGYPLDYDKIIDACAANNVAIEINANPMRLDIDWTIVPKVIDKGVMLSINPDAHHKNGFTDMKYGVLVAQKANLPKSMTLNALNRSEFESYLQNQKS